MWGYLGYYEGCSLPWGDNLSAVWGVQYHGEYHEYRGDYLEYHVGHSVMWGVS